MPESPSESSKKGKNHGKHHPHTPKNSTRGKHKRKTEHELAAEFGYTLIIETVKHLPEADGKEHAETKYYFNTTKGEIIKKIEHRKENWDIRKEHINQVAQNRNLNLLNIDNIICLCLGSFHSWTRGSGGSRSPMYFRERSINQFVLILKVIAALGLDEVFKFIQDPTFTPLDKTVLEHYGFSFPDKVLSATDIKNYHWINNRSLLYLIAAPLDLLGNLQPSHHTSSSSGKTKEGKTKEGKTTEGKTAGGGAKEGIRASAVVITTNQKIGYGIEELKTALYEGRDEIDIIDYDKDNTGVHGVKFYYRKAI